MTRLLLILAAAAGLFAGDRRCEVCRRPVHAEASAVAATAEGKKSFCCIACALTARRQRGSSVKLTQFTDHETGAALAPEQAWLVRDSDVNPCARPSVLVDASKHPHAEHFDRCAPSVLAFGRRAAAERFIRDHGGRLVRLADLMR